MGGTTTKTPDELRKEVLVRFDKRVVRMEDLHMRLLRLLEFNLTALTNECMDGMGYKALIADAKLLSKIKDLTAAFNSATDSKIRLDKTADSRKNEMTEEDEYDAVRDFIRSREARARGNFLYQEVQYHNEAKQGKATAKELSPPELEGE